MSKLPLTPEALSTKNKSEESPAARAFCERRLNWTGTPSPLGTMLPVEVTVPKARSSELRSRMVLARRGLGGVFNTALNFVKSSSGTNKTSRKIWMLATAAF